MSDHEIYHQRTESTSMTFTGSELKIRETDVFSGYGVRALNNGKLGFAFCQYEDEIQKAIDQAQQVANFSASSSFSFAPKASFKKLQLSDSSLDPSDFDLLKDFIYEAREAAESKGGKAKIISELGILNAEINNTAGLNGAYDKSEISFYVECMHGDGFGLSRMVSNTKPKSVANIGFKAAEMAKSMQEAKKPENGKYTVVVEIEALESIIEVLLPSFSGDWRRRKITKIEKDKQIFSENFTLCEDGLANASSQQPFDDEGTPSNKKFLVKGGVAKSFLYDRETAALENVDENGSCSRTSYMNPPSIGASNITISPGKYQDLDELETYLEVHYVHGAHTANPTNGDIGLEVSAGFLVEKGKRTPVKGFMITGNVFDMFSNIGAIEKELKTIDYLIAPRIAFKDLRIVS